jgi:thymidine kinase
MFSGKTEELIKRIRRAKFAKQKVIIFKPSIDTRYNKNQIVSHDSSAIDCIAISKPIEMISLAKNYDVIGVDEIQFFDESIVDCCLTLIQKGKRVIGAGLDMDFEGNPFGSTPKLLAIADDISKLRAICTKCGNMANFSRRIVEEVSQVLLGEKKEYEPRCRNCF